VYSVPTRPVDGGGRGGADALSAQERALAVLDNIQRACGESQVGLALAVVVGVTLGHGGSSVAAVCLTNGDAPAASVGQDERFVILER